MAKEAVFRHKASGPLMRAMKHIPVDRTRGEEAYGDAVRALRSGEVVGVFPEATISPSFTLKEFKSGAVRMAREAGVPLLPMALWGTQRLWTKGHPRRLGRHRFPVMMRVGAPLATDGPEQAVQLTERLRTRVQELLESAQQAYPLRPRDAGDSWWLPAHLGGTAPVPGQLNGVSPGRRGGGPGDGQRPAAISSVTAAAKASTSSSVVSNEHIQRTSPAVLVPDVEPEALLEPLDGLGGQPAKTALAWTGRSDGQALDVPHGVGEPGGHGVGVPGVAQPQVAGRAAPRTARRRTASWTPAASTSCAGTACRVPRSGFSTTTASPNSRPFLVPPNERTSTPASVVNAAAGRPASRRRWRCGRRPGARPCPARGRGRRSPGSPRACSRCPARWSG